MLKRLSPFSSPNPKTSHLPPPVSSEDILNNLNINTGTKDRSGGGKGKPAPLEETKAGVTTSGSLNAGTIPGYAIGFVPYHSPRSLSVDNITHVGSNPTSTATATATASAISSSPTASNMPFLFGSGGPNSNNNKPASHNRSNSLAPPGTLLSSTINANSGTKTPGSPAYSDAGSYFPASVSEGPTYRTPSIPGSPSRSVSGTTTFPSSATSMAGSAAPSSQGGSPPASKVASSTIASNANSSTSTTTTMPLERPYLLKSLRAFEALLATFDEYRDLHVKLAKVEKKLGKNARELSDTLGLGGSIPKKSAEGEESALLVISNALNASAALFEAASEVDSKFSKIVQKEYENLNGSCGKYFKKVAKEERTHDDLLENLDTKVKKANLAYEKRTAQNKKNSPHAMVDATEASATHEKFISQLSGLASEISSVKLKHGTSMAQKRESMAREVGRTFCGVAEGEWARSVECTKKEGVLIGDVGSWGAFVWKDGMSSKVPGDILGGGADDEQVAIGGGGDMTGVVHSLVKGHGAGDESMSSINPFSIPNGLSAQAQQQLQFQSQQQQQQQQSQQGRLLGPRPPPPGSLPSPGPGLTQALPVMHDHENQHETTTPTPTAPAMESKSLSLPGMLSGIVGSGANKTNTFLVQLPSDGDPPESAIVRPLVGNLEAPGNSESESLRRRSSKDSLTSAHTAPLLQRPFPGAGVLGESVGGGRPRSAAPDGRERVGSFGGGSAGMRSVPSSPRNDRERERYHHPDDLGVPPYRHHHLGRSNESLNDMNFKRAPSPLAPHYSSGGAGSRFASDNGYQGGEYSETDSGFGGSGSGGASLLDRDREKEERERERIFMERELRERERAIEIREREARRSHTSSPTRLRRGEEDYHVAAAEFDRGEAGRGDYGGGGGHSRSGSHNTLGVGGVNPWADLTPRAAERYERRRERERELDVSSRVSPARSRRMSSPPPMDRGRDHDRGEFYREPLPSSGPPGRDRSPLLRQQTVPVLPLHGHGGDRYLDGRLGGSPPSVGRDRTNLRRSPSLESMNSQRSYVARMKEKYAEEKALRERSMMNSAPREVFRNSGGSRVADLASRYTSSQEPPLVRSGSRDDRIASHREITRSSGFTGTSDDPYSAGRIALDEPSYDSPDWISPTDRKRTVGGGGSAYESRSGTRGPEYEDEENIPHSTACGCHTCSASKYASAGRSSGRPLRESNSDSHALGVAGGKGGYHEDDRRMTSMPIGYGKGR